MRDDLKIQVKKIYQEIKKANFKLMLLLIEHGEMQKRVIKINDNYLLTIGEVELYRLEAQLEELKLKRQIELYEIALKRHQIIEDEFISDLLINETSDFQNKIDQLRNEYVKVLVSSPRLDSFGVAELNELFRYIVKKIHPELNPNLTDVMKVFWRMAQVAYDEDDIGKLRMIKKVISSKKFQIEKEDDYEVLKLRLVSINDKVDKLVSDILKIDHEYPYDKAEILRDEIYLKSLVNTVKEETKRYQENNNKLKEKLEMLKEPSVNFKI